MKKLVVSLCALFSISLLADTTPMTSLPEGEYLGLGAYTTNWGDEGTFSSYAYVGSDFWEVSHYIDGEVRTYGAFFNFDDNGFFDIEMTYVDENGDEQTVKERGYCRSVQCHYALNFGEKIVEETVSFVTREDKIYWVGSVQPHGDSEDDLAVSWEVAMARMD